MQLKTKEACGALDALDYNFTILSALRSDHKSKDLCKNSVNLTFFCPQHRQSTKCKAPKYFAKILRLTDISGFKCTRLPSTSISQVPKQIPRNLLLKPKSEKNSEANLMLGWRAPHVLHNSLFFIEIISMNSFCFISSSPFCSNL